MLDRNEYRYNCNAYFYGVPYFLYAYYKWKYPEEYRDWEGKSVEDWYGKRYLKKHKELLEAKNEEKINL